MAGRLWKLSGKDSPNYHARDHCQDSFCNVKATHIFQQKNINVVAIFQDRNFKVTLTKTS